MSRFTEFFALKKSIAGMLFMVVLVGLGERMAERFLPIYLLALGGGTLSIGLLNGLDNLLSALYSFPGGYIADRFGINSRGYLKEGYIADITVFDYRQVRPSEQPDGKPYGIERVFRAGEEVSLED